jgi:hypothetical protein
MRLEIERAAVLVKFLAGRTMVRRIIAATTVPARRIAPHQHGQFSIRCRRSVGDDPAIIRLATDRSLMTTLAAGAM